MILQHLRIAQVRGFKEAEFTLHPQATLLVGANGVGKSTVLDVLRIMLSQMLLNISPSKIKTLSFSEEDIQVGSDFLTAELECSISGSEFTYAINKPRERYTGNPGGEGDVREQSQNTADIAEWQPESPVRVNPTESQPLAIYFSPQRSVISASSAKVSNAYTDALVSRGLYLREFAGWWLTRTALANEGHTSAGVQQNALKQAISDFLGGYSNLHAIEGQRPTLCIDKAGVTLDVRQLSDGERSVLAMVLEITRRLAQANPQFSNPAQEAGAVILIDELDLHLHPKWQRTMIGHLRRTFPKCQFIATTHSPQIISEIQPESLIFLHNENHNEKWRVVAHPALQAYGLDTNWILEHLMGVPSRPKPAQDAIDQIEEALEQSEFAEARRLLEALRTMLHGDDGEVVRLEASINTLEDLVG